jgi:hypothetical protein
MLAAGAVYLRLKRLINALSIGIAVGVVALVTTGIVGCSSWCS